LNASKSNLKDISSCFSGVPAFPSNIVTTNVCAPLGTLNALQLGITSSKEQQERMKK